MTGQVETRKQRLAAIFNLAAEGYDRESLHILPDSVKALREWRRATRPGGTPAFTSFGPDAFQPTIDGLREDAQACGAVLSDETAPPAQRTRVVGCRLPQCLARDRRVRARGAA